MNTDDIFKFDENNVKMSVRTRDTQFEFFLSVFLPCGQRMISLRVFSQHSESILMDNQIKQMRHELEINWDEYVEKYSAHERMKIIESKMKVRHRDLGEIKWS